MIETEIIKIFVEHEIGESKHFLNAVESIVKTNPHHVEIVPFSLKKNESKENLIARAIDMIPKLSQYTGKSFFIRSNVKITGGLFHAVALFKLTNKFYSDATDVEASNVILLNNELFKENKDYEISSYPSTSFFEVMRDGLYINIGHRKLKRTQTEYTNRKKEVNYKHYIDLDSHETFLFFDESYKVKDISLSTKTIYLKYLGNQLARLLGLEAQSVELGQLKGSHILIEQDIRLDPKYTKMESLCFYDVRLLKEERSYQKINDEMSRLVREDTSKFLTKVMLFDFLFGILNRDAWSYRIIERATEDLHKYNMLFDNILFEDHFSESQSSVNRVEEIKTFIVENKCKYSAEELFNKVNPKQIRSVIMESNLIPMDVREKITELFDQQFEAFIEIEDFVEAL
jgi:hypothetical protein